MQYRSPNSNSVFSIRAASHEFNKNSQLHIAVIEDNYEKVKKLIENGAADIEIKNKSGNTALHLALRYTKTDIAHFLIQNGGANVNAIDNVNFTPLNYAILNNLCESVALLLKYGADPNAKNEHNDTLLHFASAQSYSEIPIMLIKAGAKPNVINNNRFAPIHLAIIKHFPLKYFEVLLAHNGDLNIKDAYGVYPLQLAINHNLADHVKLFINHGVDTTIRDRENKTLLHLAAEAEVIKGQDNTTDIITYLIKNVIKQADINARDNNNNTPLHLAIKRRNHEFIQLLIDAGADKYAVNNEGLSLQIMAKIDPSIDNILIAYSNNIQVDRSYTIQKYNFGELYRILWKKNKTIDFIVDLMIKQKMSLNYVDQCNGTALHVATRHNNLKCVKTLIGHGANLNLTDSDNYTALHLAVYNKKIEIVKALIKGGADLNIKGGRGYTALHTAIHYEMSDYIMLLIKGGVNLNVKNRYGKSSLHLALDLDKYYDLFIDAGADPNILDFDRNTPFHIAADVKSYKVIKKLIDAGGNPDITNNNKETILHRAVYNKIECLKLILNISKNINAQDKNDQTPLHIAANYCPSSHVRLLFNAGSNIYIKDNNNNTPVKYMKDKDIIKLMVNPKITQLYEMFKDSNSYVSWLPIQVFKYELILQCKKALIKEINDEHNAQCEF